MARSFALGALFVGFQLVAVGPNTAAPTTYGNYYIEPVQKSCNDEFNCRLDFSQTPSGKFLTVKNISCYIDSSKALRIVVIGQALRAGGLTAISVPVPFSANFTNTTRYYYSLNTETYFKMAGARFPFMLVETSERSDLFVTCSIAGDLGTT